MLCFVVLFSVCIGDGLHFEFFFVCLFIVIESIYLFYFIYSVFSVSFDNLFVGVPRRGDDIVVMYYFCMMCYELQFRYVVYQVHNVRLCLRIAVLVRNIFFVSVVYCFSIFFVSSN